jgi:hypothetical protein
VFSLVSPAHSLGNLQVLAGRRLADLVGNPVGSRRNLAGQLRSVHWPLAPNRALPLLPKVMASPRPISPRMAFP